MRLEDLDPAFEAACAAGWIPEEEEDDERDDDETTDLPLNKEGGSDEQLT